MATAELSLGYATRETELRALAEEFESAEPDAVLRWATQQFGSEIALATGFGAEGCALIDMLAGIDRHTRFFYLDTDLLFPETCALIERLKARYGISFERRATELTLEAQSREYGDNLWRRDPDECCRLRKVEPLVETLAGLRAWITAIRRDQSPARAHVQVVEWDRKFGLIKINPLVRWSSIDLWKYIVRNEVPYNPLHDQGFPSIGCTPCTTSVQIGENPRAGRWRGVRKTECGLHQGIVNK